MYLWFKYIIVKRFYALVVSTENLKHVLFKKILSFLFF